MISGKRYISAFWYSSNNFGDNLNHFLLRKLSGKPVVLSDRMSPHYIVCGSILTEATMYSTVWGAGFSWDHEQPYDHNAQYLAVRGNLSAERIKKSINHIGDPALLLPLFHQPPTKKKYRYGIIPHWSEYEFYLFNYPDIHIIDPMQSVVDFINDVVSCEKVISSGLHGLITADAYGIPSAWIDKHDKDHFKYKDYYSTTENGQAIPLSEPDFNACAIRPFRYNIIELKNSCPFLSGWN